MPVYTYRCGHCGVQFERQQSYSDAPLRMCPECRRKSLKKVISPVGIAFKGSGFYSTDHRPSAGANSAAAAKKDEKKEEKKEDKKDSTSKASTAKETKETKAAEKGE